MLPACVLRVVNFSEEKSEKVHPGDLAGEFSDLEMTWLLYCAGDNHAARYTIRCMTSALKWSLSARSGGLSLVMGDRVTGAASCRRVA